eukprot:12149838-Alexandrium_andersonii.AAC.1
MGGELGARSLRGRREGRISRALGGRTESWRERIQACWGLARPRTTSPNRARGSSRSLSCAST